MFGINGKKMIYKMDKQTQYIIAKKINNNTATSSEIEKIIAAIDSGILRVAEKKGANWHVNSWVKTAILNYFGICKMTEMNVGEMIFRDKIPLKKNFENVRIVPGGNSVRYGSFLAENTIMMPPSYVNIGAYVDKGTMIDSNVLVGSCAQIGKNVHLSAGVQIGGVLEPAGARPVIIEDNAFIGAGVIIVEGIIIRKNAILAPGVLISGSTKIIETNKDGKIINEFIGEVPENAIVVPGARNRGEVFLQTPIIIGYKNKETSNKVALSNFLRDF